MEFTIPQFPKVKILECHSIPDLVGKEAKIVRIQDSEVFTYPIEVMLVTPVKIMMETPFGLAQAEIAGPFPFRPDELELVVEPKLDIFEKAFEEDKDKNGDKPV